MKENSKEKGIEQALVLEQQELSPGIFSMSIRTTSAERALPGQFVSLYCESRERLLPRPISICEIDREGGVLRLVYRIAGKGTEEFSRLQKGDTIRMLAPLGNGFPLHRGRAVLVGGGIGVPPMLQLARELRQAGTQVTVVLGYRDRETFLAQEFAQTADEVLIATDDGSLGVRGTVIDAMNEQSVTGDVIYACGPKPMLRGVKAYAGEKKILCYVSLEERMACGVGACLACVCQTVETDAHSQVKNRRVCKDGPVFLAEEVEL